LSLWQSNGPAAFQEVPHFHMHVMPRWTDDGLLRIYPKKLGPVQEEELERQAAAIRAALD
jgi:histidine triad (HIT) family protein